MVKVQTNSSGKVYVSGGKALAAKELGTKSITQNGTYVASSDSLDGFNSVTVNVSGGGGNEADIKREIVDGVYKVPTNITSYTLPSTVNTIGKYGLTAAFASNTGLTSVNLSNVIAVDFKGLMNTFTGCTGLTNVDLSSLTTILNNFALDSTFSSCTNLTSINLSGLTTVSKVNALQKICQSCTSLTNVNLSNLATITAHDVFNGAFSSCISLTSISFPALTTISKENVFYLTFQNCTSLTSISFPVLTTISGKEIFYLAFSGCTSLTSVSFPSLTTTSFGSYKNQFEAMLYGITGCTLHFPSNLESTIQGLTMYPNFGGTNTILAFDLTATS